MHSRERSVKTWKDMEGGCWKGGVFPRWVGRRPMKHSGRDDKFIASEELSSRQSVAEWRDLPVLSPLVRAAAIMSSRSTRAVLIDNRIKEKAGTSRPLFFPTPP
jgi:hypothetical protein